MAVLRYRRPGYIGSDNDRDLGPATGRVHFTRGMAFGGVIVQGLTGKEKTRATEKARGNERRVLEDGTVVSLKPQRPPKALCGRAFPRNGRTCAREVGHGYECKSRHALDIIAERRRAVFVR